MILLRQPVKYRAWWDTKLCRDWQLTGYVARLWGRTFAPVRHDIPDNDRDHLRW